MAQPNVYSTWKSEQPSDEIIMVLQKGERPQGIIEAGIIVLSEVIQIPQTANDAVTMRYRLQEARSKLFEAAKEYARNSNDSRAGKITYIDNIRIESHSISAHLIELVFYGNAHGYPE